MNAKDRKEAERLFQEAMDLDSEERSAFLDERLGKEPSPLRDEVESLLDCIEDGRLSSLEEPELLEDTEARLVGTRIGPYRLEKLLGEGGFGSVFLAEQEGPIQRKVALKIIKLGMDTRQVISRFERERQALALMDHPHIARVYDAGATGHGRPFFVMEYVDGVPITAFCDRENLDTKARLRLFAEVCRAVQHAHQKGMIHRDLKPSNVLVTLQDGKPVPKVIDFGIAKATGRGEGRETRFTEFYHLIGTPEYMSPEQAGGEMDVDTRTDIYSLGVLLYVLLTGRTPFDPETLQRAAYGEIQRIIREVDPPTPSQSLSRMGPKLDTVARSRQVAPQALCRLVRGDLDWIAMRCLEKDRNRRYGTAEMLADDVERHLDHQPVQASPPSALYALRKFVRRNRMAVTVGGLVVAAVLGTCSFAVYGYVQADRAREAIAAQKTTVEKARLAEQVLRKEAQTEAERAKKETRKYGTVNKFLQRMLAEADPGQALGRKVTIQEVLKKAADEVDEGALAMQPEVESDLRLQLGRIEMALGNYKTAYSHYAQAESLRIKALGEEHIDTIYARSQVADALTALGDKKKSVSIYREVLAAQRKRLGPDHIQSLESLNGLGTALWGISDEAEKLHREALDRWRRVGGEDHPRTAKSLHYLGTVLWQQKRFTEAREVLTEALEKERRILGPQHPDVLKTLNNLALVLDSLGFAEKAEEVYKECVEIQHVVLGPTHPETKRTLSNLISLLLREDKIDSARPYFVRRIEALRETAAKPNALSREHNEYAWYLLTVEDEFLRDPETARIEAEEALRKVGGRSPLYWDTLALALMQLDRIEEAIKAQQKAIDLSGSEDLKIRQGFEKRMEELKMLLNKQ